MGAPIVHFEVIGSDFEKLRPFYEGLFGWDLEPEGPERIAFLPPGEGIPGAVGGAGERGYGVTIYARVPDLRAALDRAVELGAEVVMEPTQVGVNVDVAQFRDPEGHLIGLVRG